MRLPNCRQRTPLRYHSVRLPERQPDRHVWLKYGTELLLESTLQIDAEGNPVTWSRSGGRRSGGAAKK